MIEVTNPLSFTDILGGKLEPAEIARFLTDLAVRGETVDDIVAAATGSCH
jgi:anthranilate phosphoribosyltransferase